MDRSHTSEGWNDSSSASWQRMRGWEALVNVSQSLPYLPWETVSHHLPCSNEGRGFLPNPLRTEMQTVRPLSADGLLGSGVSHNSPCSYLTLFILVSGTRTIGSWDLWLIFLSLSMKVINYLNLKAAHCIFLASACSVWARQVIDKRLREDICNV